jgi:hypothetical protein
MKTHLKFLLVIDNFGNAALRSTVEAPWTDVAWTEHIRYHAAHAIGVKGLRYHGTVSKNERDERHGGCLTT